MPAGREKKEGKMYRLEIRVPVIINNSKHCNSRLASPVTHSWRMECVALSEDKDELGKYAESLPLEWFYDRKRQYSIEEQKQ